MRIYLDFVIRDLGFTLLVNYHTMENLPLHVSLIFTAVVFTVFGFLFYASYRAFETPKRFGSTLTLSALMGWLLLTGALTHKGFFEHIGMPPRLMLFVAPILILILVLLILPKTRAFLLRMPITTLTYIHLVRVPVEICLWWLFEAGLVAEEMTFEGANFDILAGITAPFAGVFLVGKKSSNKFGAIVWNLVSLGLLLNIVIRAISLTPYFYDGSGTELMNTAIFYVPFVWLPLFVVPAVLFSHLVSLVKLFGKEE